MHTFIFDVGKTNLKCQLLAEQGEVLWSATKPNSSIEGAPYTHFDIEAIWQWLLGCLREAAQKYSVSKINISTHGACAVLLDENGELVLPVLDYEYSGLEQETQGYETVRPPFSQTLSPKLSAGLNLGKQLWWLQTKFPQQYSRVKTVLFYPQYWAWRLSGIAVSERTSLGCHTDLWQPANNGYSSLIDHLNLRNKLAPLIDNWQPVGSIQKSIADITWLSEDCQVYPGVHDSNASLAWHLKNVATDNSSTSDLTVVSSGTWIITMAMGTPTAALTEEQDMLANVNIYGKPVSCARFMGGKEFETLCAITGATESDVIDVASLQQAIDDKVYALPCFAGASGPYANNTGAIVGTPSNGKALATLYLAMMIDLELDLLKSTGQVVFGSTSLKNPLLCQLLVQLRPQQTFLLSGQEAGSIKGCWALTRWQEPLLVQAPYVQAEATTLQGLNSYRDHWRQLIAR